MKCTGSPGHGSRFITNTAAEKLVREWGQWGALRGPGVGALRGGHWACGWELLMGGRGEGLRGVWYPLPRWFWDAYIRCLPLQHKVITSFLGFRESEKQR